MSGMTAIILAAGKGERLKPLTTQIPKPLITVAGKTLLQRNIDCLDQSGIKKIIVNGSRMGDQIESFLENHNQSNISFDYINEGEEPLGTAGAIFNIIDKGLINDDHFWVINADIMTNFSFSAIQLNSSVMGHIILVPNPVHNLSGDFCLEEIELRFLVISDILSVGSVIFQSSASFNQHRDILHLQIC